MAVRFTAFSAHCFIGLHTTAVRSVTKPAATCPCAFTKQTQQRLNHKAHGATLGPELYMLPLFHCPVLYAICLIMWETDVSENRCDYSTVLHQLTAGNSARYSTCL